jgi:hypothetical protein
LHDLVAELFEAAAVCLSPVRWPQLDGDAAEVRDLANLLDSQEPDFLVLHDSWEVLVELAERTERLRARVLKEQPEQEVWLIEKRPWLDPKLKLIGKAKKLAGGSSSSPRSRASRSGRKQKALAQRSA